MGRTKKHWQVYNSALTTFQKRHVIFVGRLACAAWRNHPALKSEIDKLVSVTPFSIKAIKSPKLNILLYLISKLESKMLYSIYRKSKQLVFFMHAGKNCPSSLVCRDVCQTIKCVKSVIPYLISKSESETLYLLPKIHVQLVFVLRKPRPIFWHVETYAKQ